MKNYTITKKMYNNIGVQMYLLPVKENSSCINTYIIPSDQLDAINQYKTIHDRNKRLLARSFLYEFLNKYYAITNFEISTGTYLKPYFKALPTIDFSFSYTEDYVFIAVYSAKIGADIEYINPQFNTHEIAPQIMCETELHTFLSLADKPADQQAFFYNVFSAKESIVKAFGTGLNYDLKTINTMEKKMLFFEQRKFVQENLTLLDHYSVSICYEL